MYSINLQKISLDQFLEILTSVELLPGRRVLLDNLDQIIEEFKHHGIKNLSDLQILLKKKGDYPKLAREYKTTESYLIILNREINSYQSKKVDLAKINVFNKSEIEVLKSSQIRNTRDVYQKMQNSASRKAISALTKIDEAKLYSALQYSDLIRINGVGPLFAELLLEAGIHNVSGFGSKPTGEILESYQQMIEKKGIRAPQLGSKDIEYCKRFVTLLDQEIEW